MRRVIALFLSAALLAHASGCVTKKVKKALQQEARASLTVTGDPVVLATLQEELSLLYKVGVTIETIEKGVTILRIVGAYAAVVDAIVWLIKQNLRLLANDDVTNTLLEVALAALK